MSANTKYATAVHICIYLHYSERKVIPSKEIAESVKTNPVVIRRLIHDLKEHDIVKSTSGPSGGFSLNKSAKNVSLWDIYMATRDEEFFKRPQVNPDCVVSSHLKILVYDVFSEAEQSMKTVLQQTTIHDLEKNLEKIIGKDTQKAVKEGQ
ncbi:MAG: Rrf2 family transcriptional regulator [Fulvivirga sp.]|nr:Rrf2 family transcriptional regulator [Fulvivirga sp.]